MQNSSGTLILTNWESIRNNPCQEYKNPLKNAFKKAFFLYLKPFFPYIYSRKYSQFFVKQTR